MAATARNTRPATSKAAQEQSFSAEERAAMKERAAEVSANRRRGSKAAADGEQDVLGKIAGMGEPDRAIAERLHAIIRDTAPQLTPRTWYGMPAYAQDGSVLCFFQPAGKFKTRYATLGFSDKANLDEGAMWPVTYALAELTADSEARIAALVRQAAGEA